MKIEQLFSRDQIAERVNELGRKISADYSDKKQLLVLCILNGSIFFTADLLREISVPCNLNCIKAKSYQGTQSTGNVNISYGADVDVSGCDVLIIEDIVDTGTTLKALIEKYNLQKPNSLKVCTFLNKKERRTSDVSADYVGFEIDDIFVVGYGMDYDGKYREIPYIGYITEG